MNTYLQYRISNAHVSVVEYYTSTQGMCWKQCVKGRYYIDKEWHFCYKDTVSTCVLYGVTRQLFKAIANITKIFWLNDAPSEVNKSTCSAADHKAMIYTSQVTNTPAPYLPHRLKHCHCQFSKRHMHHGYCILIVQRPATKTAALHKVIYCSRTLHQRWAMLLRLQTARRCNHICAKQLLLFVRN